MILDKILYNYLYIDQIQDLVVHLSRLLKLNFMWNYQNLTGLANITIHKWYMDMIFPIQHVILKILYHVKSLGLKKVLYSMEIADELKTEFKRWTIAESYHNIKAGIRISGQKYCQLYLYVVQNIINFGDFCSWKGMFLAQRNSADRGCWFSLWWEECVYTVNPVAECWVAMTHLNTNILHTGSTSCHF